MRKPKWRELGEAIRALVNGPVTTRFPFEQVEPPPNFRGKPEFQPDSCVGCAACAEICPAGAIVVLHDVTGHPAMRKLEIRLDQCIFCGQCELNCLTHEGVHLTQKYDLATFDRHSARESIEKELVLCESCGSIITTREHLRFITEGNRGEVLFESRLDAGTGGGAGSGGILTS